MRTLFPIAVVLLALLALPGVAVFAADLLGYEAEINRALEDRLGVSHHLAISLPAAIVLACVPPIIILLYFLRLKRKPVTVSSTFLWKKSIEDLHVNRLMQWMRRNVLLLLQLLAALTLIYAILGPRLHGRIGGGKHYILLIDNSASMAATDLKPTRLDWAKAEALREIDRAGDADTGMVIVFNSTAEILQSYTTTKDELRAAVQRIEPTFKPTRLDEALSLAASLANPQKSTADEAVKPADVEPGKARTYVPIEQDGFAAEVHLISDGRFPAPEFALANLIVNLHVPPVPNTDHVHADNVGIVSFEVERGWHKPLSDDVYEAGESPPKMTQADAEDVSKLTVTAVVKSHREEKTPSFKVRVDVLEDGDRLVRSYARTVSLPGKTADEPAKRSVAFHLPDVPEGADRVLRCTVDAADAFAPDNTAWLCFGVVKKARVLIVSPDNNFMLRNFFDLKAIAHMCEPTWLTPASLENAKDYLNPAREGRYDLVVFDRCSPVREDSLPAANTFFIGHPPPPYALPNNGPKAVTMTRGPTVQGWDDRHPIMAGLRGLYDIGIDESFKLPDLPEGSKKLMEADRGHVLLLAVPRGAFTDVTLTFALLSSDGKWNTRWPLENSFVLFLRNLVLSLGNVRDASAEEPTLPGQEKLLRPGAAKSVLVTRPDGGTRKLDRGNRPEVAFGDTALLGLYTAEWDNQTRRFAVNLLPANDHDEGDIAPVESVNIGNQTITAGEARKPPRELWKYLVLAGIVVLLGEWWLYNRRVQI